MATLERRELKKKGKNRKSHTWYVQYSFNGKRRRVAAFTDRQASQQLAGNIENLKSCRSTDTPASKKLTDAIDRLPERILDHLRNAGLLDETQTAGARPLSQHLEEWKKHLGSRGDTSDHVKQRFGRAKRLLQAAGARWWNDIEADRIETALTHFRDKKGLSVSTVNAYLSAVKQFTRWMYRSRRAPDEPLRHLSRQNPNGKQIVKRRVLTQSETSALVNTAYNSEMVREGADGPTRELLYRMALETGLRFNELKTLKVHHLNLEGSPPTVTVEGSYSKSGRTDALPLKADMAEDLRRHCSDRMPAAPVFDMWSSAEGSLMIKPDLEAAGILTKKMKI